MKITLTRTEIREAVAFHINNRLEGRFYGGEARQEQKVVASNVILVDAKGLMLQGVIEAQVHTIVTEVPPS